MRGPFTSMNWVGFELGYEILPLGGENEIAPFKNTSCQIAQSQFRKLGNFFSPPRIQWWSVGLEFLDPLIA